MCPEFYCLLIFLLLYTLCQLWLIEWLPWYFLNLNIIYPDIFLSCSFPVRNSWDFEIIWESLLEFNEWKQSNITGLLNESTFTLYFQKCWKLCWVSQRLFVLIYSILTYFLLCSQVASAGYGLDDTKTIDILKTIRAANGFAFAILLMPFSFEGQRRKDEVGWIKIILISIFEIVKIIKIIEESVLFLTELSSVCWNLIACCSAQWIPLRFCKLYGVIFCSLRF